MEIKGNVNKAVERGVLKNEREIRIATKSLVAGAVTAAKEAKKYKVTPGHFSRGWVKHIRAIGGNCPPYRCLARSTICRVEELKAENSIFRALLSDNE